MKRQQRIATVVSAYILSACAAMLAPDTNPNDPQAVLRAIGVKRDEFEKVTNYIGPNAANKPDSLFIRAVKTDAGRMTYQIYVMDQYDGEWRFYNSAFDSNGTKLNTTQISRDVIACGSSSCIQQEHLGLNVSREYLEKAQQLGIRFKVSGRAGEEIFFIPSAYIRAFLAVAK
ncbi:MAG: hypothetical protein KA388_09000 [Rhodocyclaceae bacterium]|nr:hypothetical protein [Rhodocyclaceae bacterium]